MSAPKCARCTKSVYAAEEVVAIGKKFHSECFTCSTCNTRLSSTNLCESQGSLYCSGCYGKQFGPKGFGIGNHSVMTGQSVVNQSINQSTDKCGACGAANQKNKFCGECGKPTNTPSSTLITNQPVSPSPPSPTINQSVKPASPSPSVPTSKPSVAAASKMFNGGSTVSDLCATCNKKVYSAESVKAAGLQFHDTCLVCKECKKTVNQSTLNERGGCVYCAPCYGKLYGPKGFGIGNHSVYTGK